MSKALANGRQPMVLSYMWKLQKTAAGEIVCSCPHIAYCLHYMFNLLGSGNLAYHGDGLQDNSPRERANEFAQLHLQDK